ncbi:hypothetical protein [Yinghuangia seranimata]|uniref:hypothetical protein n=1 Tax=Yinghuangia seranimata TaxID=408067 RepID=UPI00248BCA74|nr:hypothetical protein [Yinghuangia seranimata]MDI2124899.1 hypothetical protein [Yinghuangia seranimata]
MRKTRRAALAAACAAGVTAGLVAVAGPAAAAGTGTGVYNCSGGGFSFPNVDVEFQRNGANYLTVTADIAPGTTIGTGGLVATLKWGGTPADIGSVSNTSPQGPGAPVVVEKANSPALPSAPSTVVLVVTPPGVTITCTKVSSSWPGGGI